MQESTAIIEAAKQVREAINQARQDIIEKAVALRVEYYGEIYRRKEDGDRGYLGIRLRERVTGVTIEWGRGQGKGRYAKILKKGKGSKYPASAFKSFRPWERAIALEYEEQFAVLRQLADALLRMHRANIDVFRLAGMDVSDLEALESKDTEVGGDDQDGFGGGLANSGSHETTEV